VLTDRAEKLGSLEVSISATMVLLGYRQLLELHRAKLGLSCSFNGVVLVARLAFLALDLSRSRLK
jgi:hypothetical protein